MEIRIQHGAIIIYRPKHPEFHRPCGVYTTQSAWLYIALNMKKNKIKRVCIIRPFFFFLIGISFSAMNGNGYTTHKWRHAFPPLSFLYNITCIYILYIHYKNKNICVASFHCVLRIGCHQIKCRVLYNV